MLAIIDSCAVLGIEAHIVRTEADVGRGEGFISVVGLPDKAVQESTQRVASAIRNSNFSFPNCRITINLAPADMRKEGPSFDLPIALSILAATEQMATQDMEGLIAVGELSLDGSVRPISGVLPIALAARDRKRTGLIVPAGNVAEASVVEGLHVYPVQTLWEAAEVVAYPERRQPAECTAGRWDLSEPVYQVDFADVKGQSMVKRALEVAAAGGHNVVMVGPPGSGKTMLAMRLPTILPPLSTEEALEVTKIYSISGNLPRGVGLITTRPFRSPHHTISSAGLAGGGTIPKPGEVSMAHFGVLFLDELPEFSRDTLEVLRGPIEDGVVNVSRVAGTAQFPARMMMVAALNPCPCGYFTDATKACTCTSQRIRSYLQRISGPLLDRIDIHIEVPRLARDELLTTSESESSRQIRERVQRARQVQAQRLAEDGIFCNAHMRPRELKKYCALSDSVRDFLSGAIDQLGLSARAFDRIVKLSRTIADMEGEEQISAQHVGEAIGYRSLERKLWQ